jgi:HEAT repeat protein
MPKFSEFLKWFGDLFAMFKYFPLWFQILLIFSTLLLLIVGGLFIHFYSVTNLRLTTQTAVTQIEDNALSGDGPAMIKLSFSGSPKAYDILASVIQTSPDEQRRQAAISAIVNLKDKRTTALLGNILVKEKWIIAGDCAVALGRAKDPNAIPFLLRALQLHIDWVVGQKSAEALGSFEPTAPILQALIRAFDEDNSFIQDAAKQSLANYGVKALPLLTENLERSSSSYQSLVATVQTIALIGDKQSVPSLKAFQQRIQLSDLDNKQRAVLESEAQKALDVVQ